MKRLLLLLFIAILAFPSSAQDNRYAQNLIEVESYLDSMLAFWRIPGMAIGIVHKDQLIYAKGFGFRDAAKRLPVNSKTIFPIASNTKLFTAIAACMLHEEGKLNIDQPVRNYLPELVFSTDELNAKTTIRDMLSHRTGLPRYDGIWVNAPYTRRELLDKVTHMKPNQGFREGYQYNNMMYAAAGVAMEKVTGMSWEDIIRQKLLKPLGMNSTGFTNTEAQAGGNYSLSYFTPLGSSEVLAKKYEAQSTALGPAGTIKSCIEDMSQWMIALLNNGDFMGQKVIPEKAIRNTLIAKSITDPEFAQPELSQGVYGLGRWMLTYKGYQIAMHTGSIDGFYSNLTLLPNEQLAIFMVHNYTEAGGSRSQMVLPVIDRLLNLELTNWNARWKKDYDENLKRAITRRDSIGRMQVPNTVPSHDLAQYAGTFSNVLYGKMNVDLVNNQLFIVFREQRSPLFHFHYDQFTTKEEKTDYSDFRLNFLTNTAGEIDRFTLSPFGDPVAEFVKVKK